MSRLALKCGLSAAAAVAIAAPLAASMVYQGVRTRREDRESPGLGERVDVDGHQVHVRRMGDAAAGPTVLFESGLSSPLEMWGWVQAAVAESASTISYDRAGVGWSESRPLPRTAERITDELERLLEVLGETGPLVLVGHSYGGMLLRAFAQRHPERVAGVVLVDSAHPEQLARSARQRLGVPMMQAGLQSSLFRARFGRIPASTLAENEELAQLAEPERRAVIARMKATRGWATVVAEVDAWLKHVNEEIRPTVLQPDVPLFVVSASDTEKSDPVHGELQRELASLSGVSVQQTLPGTTHLGLLCSAESARNVAAAVREVVDAVRTGLVVKPVELETVGDKT